MNEQLLLQWADGTLSDVEERDLYRWMVRCTDPKLPATLLGILRSQREEQADATQSGLGAVWASLVDHWERLMGGDHANWVQPGMALRAASALGEVRATAHLVLDENERVQVAVERAADESVTVVLTDVDGGFQVLTVSEAGRAALPDVVGRRPTIWVVWEKVRPVTSVEELSRVLMDDSVQTNALRWRD